MVSSIHKDCQFIQNQQQLTLATTTRLVTTLQEIAGMPKHFESVPLVVVRRRRRASGSQCITLAAHAINTNPMPPSMRNVFLKPTAEMKMRVTGVHTRPPIPVPVTMQWLC